jgi:hypothetical protein
MIEGVCPPGLREFNVIVLNMDLRRHSGAGGFAYVASQKRNDWFFVPYIRVWVSPTEEAARAVVPANKDYLETIYGSRMEALLFVVAHELRHLWQYKFKWKKRVWGSKKGVFSERDADAWAWKMLRRYRRGELNESRKTSLTWPYRHEK